MSAISLVLNKLKPYDPTLNEDMSMYDHLPYQRDIDLCNEHTVALYSGNILKFYNCRINEPYTLENSDDLAFQKIEEHKRIKEAQEKMNAAEPQENEPAAASREPEGELTDEQIDSLLKNTGNSEPLTDDDFF